MLSAGVKSFPERARVRGGFPASQPMDNRREQFSDPMPFEVDRDGDNGSCFPDARLDGHIVVRSDRTVDAARDNPPRRIEFRYLRRRGPLHEPDPASYGEP